MKKIATIAIAGLVAAASLNAADFKGSGASFPYSVYQGWIKAYNKATGVKIDYISEGSGAGIKHIEARQSNFVGSDKPLTPRVLKKNGLSLVGGFVFFLFLVSGPGTAMAIPSFARQTGLSCAACHTVFPELTSFGRQFKLNGYTLTGIKTINETKTNKEGKKSKLLK
ncbi:MAG: substrate-binding domain-containing protein, partial [Campylobacteraceae bacterium]|nr:substrate-binding domain-containing protein [Campylobacteraceae bacterium]